MTIEEARANFLEAIEVLKKQVSKIAERDDEQPDLQGCTHPVTRTMHAEKKYEIDWCTVCGAWRTVGHKMFDPDAATGEWHKPTHKRP